MSSNNDSATQVPVAELHDEGKSSPNNNNGSNVTEAVNVGGGGGASDSAQTYFIGNLPRESTEVDVLNYFASYGPVERFKLCYSSDGRTRGFGWLTFARPVHDLVQRGPYRMGGRELTVEPSHARIYNRSGVSVSSLAGRRHVSGGGGGGASGPGVVGSRRHMSSEHALMSGAVGATVLYGGVGDSEHARRARRHGRGHRRNRSPSSRSSSSSSYTSSSTSSASSRASSRSSTGHKRNSGGRRKTKHARHKDAPPPPPMPSPATAVVPPPLAAAVTTSSVTAASSAAAPPHSFAPPSASPSDAFVCLPMALCPPQFLCDPRVFAARLDRTRVGALTICGSVMQSPFTPHEQQQQQQQQPPSSTMTPSVARREQTAAMAANYHHVPGLATPDHIATLPQHPSSVNMTLPSPPPPPSSSSSSSSSTLRHGMSASHGAPFASYASLQSYGVMQPPLSSSSSSSSSSVPQSSALLQQQQQRPAMPR